MQETSDSPSAAELPFARYIPLIVLLVSVLVLLIVPFKIIGYGYLPPDDALRHVGKVLSGKTWPEIMVMREGITIDHNAGWHAILSAVARWTGWGADGLLSFSVAFLCLAFLLAPLPQIRRPEAWLLALLALVTAFPHLVFRICLGRPFILVMALIMCVLLSWVKQGDRVSKSTLALTVLAMGVAAWVHGGWYLLCLPAAGFFAAQQWRRGLQLTACWLAGSFLGGLFTGHPLHFLAQQLSVLVSCFGSHSLQRMLVTEFQPTDGLFPMIVLAALLLVARPLRGRSVAEAFRDPLFMMLLVCWVLSFKVRRFWLDWGMPAFLLWLALEFRDILDRHVGRESLKRLVITALAAGGFFLSSTADLEGRWTHNLTNEYLTVDKLTSDGHADWLPEPGGIVYSDDMRVFYQTFFFNPKAPWRYMLGFESTFMPPEDLKTFRAIQWNFGTPQAYEPWVKRMRPEDRLILRGGLGARPEISGLEWLYAVSDTWIGRLPRPAPPEADGATP
jgi:hypothetical protein